MSKVYVTQHVTRQGPDGVRRPLDLTSALRFGEMVELLPTGMSSLTPIPSIRELRSKLENFSDDDYLIPLGDPALMLAAGMVAASVNGGRVKVLRYDRISGEYMPIQLDTFGRREGFSDERKD